MAASGSQTPKASKDGTPIIDVEEPPADGVNVDETVDGDDNLGDKTRSFVWENFTKIEGHRAQCNHCPTTIAAHPRTNGTTAMKTHLIKTCKKSPYYKKVDKKQATLSFKPKGSGEGSGSLVNHKFSQEKCRNLFARMCIRDNRSFSSVDDQGFRDFVWELNPSFVFPSRWTVARDCMKIYQEEKKQLKAILKDQMVSLTTDTWTSIQNFNYMCLTAHWIDAGWVLRKKILNFCQIKNHKAETIGKLVYLCLEEWGIDRVFTITVDNASSNDGAIKYLKKMLKGPHTVMDFKFLHLRCNAHIINLVVRDGLQEQFDSIAKIRNAVRFLRSSSSRFLAFKASVEKEKIQCRKKPCLDVETRWNSTYLMLETANKFKKAFERLRVVDSGYRSYFINEVPEVDSTRITRKRKRSGRVEGAPLEDDFENSAVFVEFLQIFYDVTTKISGSKYVTANLVFDEISKLHKSIKDIMRDGDEKKKTMGESMKAKFDKYWDDLDNINLLMYVALVLDPRNKLAYLGYSLTRIYGKVPKVKQIQILVTSTLKELLEDYESKIEKPKEQTSSTDKLVDDDTCFDEASDYLNYLKEEGVAQVDNNEVEMYLKDGAEKRVDDSVFDILGWWKINSTKFPILSQVAKHVLAMPISSVASESAFSTGGRVIDKYRSSLTPKTAEALICAQDWLHSTSSDIQDSVMHGPQLEDYTENLEKIEEDLSMSRKKTPKDTVEEDDEDWD